MTETPAGYGESPEGSPRHVGVAEAKATFSAMIEGVQHRSERYVIERHGKPAAALVSVEELERLVAGQSAPVGHSGGAGLIGLFDGFLTDEEIDEMVDHIYDGRERDRHSPARVDFSDIVD